MVEDRIRIINTLDSEIKELEEYIEQLKLANKILQLKIIKKETELIVES